MELKENRIDYIDVAKAIGIFAIWLGHYGTDAGYAYLWVFTWHVPLFFFLSGCTVHMEKSRTVFEYIKHKIKTILIPYVFFRVINTMIYILRENEDSIEKIKMGLRLIITGEMRNAGYLQGIALWFLTCLFLVSMIFHIMSKICNRYILLVLSIFLRFMGCDYINNDSIWNIDDVCKLLFFYCVGYVVFPYVKLLFENLHKKSIFAMSVCVIIYSTLLFGGINIFEKVQWFNMFLKPLLGIYICLLGAYVLKDIEIIQKIGEKSLFLCGTEDIIRYLVFDLFAMIGLEISLINPIMVYLLVVFLIWIDWKMLVPIIEKSICRILKNTNSLKGNKLG